MRKLLANRCLSVKNNISTTIKHSPKKFIFRFTFILLSIAALYFAVSGGLHFIISLGGLGTVIIKKLFFIAHAAPFVVIPVCT